MNEKTEGVDGLSSDEAFHRGIKVGIWGMNEKWKTERNKTDNYYHRRELLMEFMKRIEPVASDKTIKEYVENFLDKWKKKQQQPEQNS